MVKKIEHSPKFVDETSNFIKETYHLFDIAEGIDTEIIEKRAKRILDIIDLDQMLSLSYSEEEVDKAFAILQSVLEYKNRAQNALFPSETLIHGEFVLGRTKPVIINGEAYKEYRLKGKKKDSKSKISLGKSKKCDKKYTVFIKLNSLGRPEYSRELETEKDYQFTRDEILESFINI